MDNSAAQLLLIEDDELLAELIVECLEQEGFNVRHVITGEEACTLAINTRFNLIICDLMLPDIHGFQLIENLDFSHTCPVIFLTAISDDDTQIKGLEKGAADFIAKPVDPAVLVARIKANLRQYTSRPDSVTLKSFEFDRRNKSLTRHGERVAITNQEFDILWLFIKKPESPLTREYLFEQIIGREYDGLDRAVDLKISRLRKKLEQLNCPEIKIETMRGEGYMLTIEVEHE